MAGKPVDILTGISARHNKPVLSHYQRDISEDLTMEYVE
jgi:hypothetical protein